MSENQPARGNPFKWVALALAFVVLMTFVVLNQGDKTVNTTSTADGQPTTTAITAPAPTNAPTTQPAPTTTRPPAVTYSYTPGGPGYAKTVQDVGDGWTRIRRASNEEFFAWVSLYRIRCDKPVEGKLQWPHPTQLNVYGPISCKIEIKRDTRWADDLKAEHAGETDYVLPSDPYDRANSKNSPLGLGWFFKGVGTVRVNGGTPVVFNGPGVQQIAYPRDYAGVITIELTVPENGFFQLNQGERLTDKDNFQLS